MDPPFVVLLAALVSYGALALLVFAPACAALARKKHRDSETWLLLGAVGGPLALAWIAASSTRPRLNGADALQGRRRRTPAERIPSGAAVMSARCLQCGALTREGHMCQAEAIEDRIQRRWTVRIGGQRIIGPP